MTRAYFNHYDVGDPSDGYTGKLTVAFSVENDNIVYGWAWCAPKDPFVKIIGREYALDRMEMGKFKLTGVVDSILDKGLNVFQVCEIIKETVTMAFAPTWAEGHLVISRSAGRKFKGITTSEAIRALKNRFSLDSLQRFELEPLSDLLDESTSGCCGKCHDSRADQEMLEEEDEMDCCSCCSCNGKDNGDE